MHSRRQPRYRRSNHDNEEDSVINDKNSSYSYKVIAYALGVLLCMSLVSQAYSSGLFSSGSPPRTSNLPSFRSSPLPSINQYEDFPDINIQEVKAKAMALLKPRDGEGEREEEEEEEQRRQEEEEEANFIRQQAIADAENAAEKAKQELARKSHDTLLEESLNLAKEQIMELHMMKYESHLVMETDPYAQERIRAAQSSIRKFLILKYGAGPYYVKMVLQFPDSMMQDATSGGLKGSNSLATLREEEIIIELAPIDYVPYSVYMFLEKIVHGYKSGAFHRNAGHVLQAMVTVHDEQHHQIHERFAWQEYSPHYPHVKYTLGYAGRPSSNGAFYISTMDNTHNHGPASQGSKTEADSIIGRVFKGEDVVRRMCKQPNKGGNGFIKSPADYIKILSLELITTH